MKGRIAIVQKPKQKLRYQDSFHFGSMNPCPFHQTLPKRNTDACKTRVFSTNLISASKHHAVKCLGIRRHLFGIWTGQTIRREPVISLAASGVITHSERPSDRSMLATKPTFSRLVAALLLLLV